MLDLACGYGRHARHLARRNEVWAVDFQKEYLHAMMRGLRGSQAKNLHAVRADMRSLPIADVCMDAALMLFNSFGYFADASRSPADSTTAPRQQVWKLPHVFYERQLVSPDFGRHSGTVQGVVQAPLELRESGTDGNALVLREIARVLKPDGQLLLELPNPKPLLQAVAKNPRRHVVTGAFEIEEQYDWDGEAQVLHNRTRFRTRDKIEEAEYHLRLYQSKEIRSLLGANGLSVVRLYGNYEDDKYVAASSPILLVHARKTRFSRGARS